MTQTAINNAVNAVVNNFTGSRIAMPNGAYMGECTAPITWYLHYLGLQWNLPMANNRADGWGIAHPAELMPYFTFEVFQQGKAYPRGTILMWDSPHIAIVLSDGGGDNVVTCFEQNADPDGAPCGTHSRTLNTSHRTCTYAMVPIIEAPAPPSPPAPKYTVTETYNPGKLIQLNKDTNLWGMNYDFNFMVDHPIEAHSKGEVWTVTNKVHHQDGYDYYRRDGQVDGFNVLDCDDYTPPPPIPPAGPVAFPGNGTVYEVVVPLQGYQSATQAGNHSGTAQAVPEGEYFIFRYYSDARKDLINITKDKTKPGWWINSADNVIPPVPEPEPVPKIFIGPRESSVPEPEIAVVPETDQSWKASYTPLLTNRKPVAYVILQTTEIKDLASIGKTMGLKQYQEIHIYGTFEKDGITYGRPKLSNDSAFRYFYGIPLKLADGTDPGIAEPEQQLYNTDTTVAERKALGILTLHDRQIQLTATIEKYVEPAVKLIDGIIKRPKK